MNRRALALTAAGLLLAAGALAAHDMFLKLGSYFLEPGDRARVMLLNGTFERSGNAIARDRMTDVSVVGPGPGDVAHPDTALWSDSADTAVLPVETGDAGTYVVGVSTRPRTFTLSGEDFDAYLRHDGVLDVLERRRATGRLGTEATETYAKHVKAVVQVGERRSDGWKVRLGYPVELVPVANPYTLSGGDTLPLRLLEDGEPVPDQIVWAAWEGWQADAGGEGEAGDGAHREPIRTRTDADGVVRIPLEEPGRWYVRLIHMERAEEDPEVDYVSKWATLTFEVR